MTKSFETGSESALKSGPSPTRWCRERALFIILTTQRLRIQRRQSPVPLTLHGMLVRNAGSPDPIILFSESLEVLGLGI